VSIFHRNQLNYDRNGQAHFAIDTTDVWAISSLANGRLETTIPTIYRVIGMLTVRGNSSHPHVGQTIFFNFELEYSQAIDPAVVGTPIVASFGPLGEFSLKTHSALGYFGFFSPDAEIDLLFSSVSNRPVISGQSWLYSCTNAPTGPCAPFYIAPGTNIYGTACAEIFEVPTPEPRPHCLSVTFISSR
jgi:hypothetical protein